jgi:hypothetical protein
MLKESDFDDFNNNINNFYDLFCISNKVNLFNESNALFIILLILGAFEDFEN